MILQINPLYTLMDSSFWFDTIDMGWSIVHVYIEGSQVIIYKVVFLSLKILIVLANSVDPDEISSGSSLFAKVCIYERLVYKGL